MISGQKNSSESKDKKSEHLLNAQEQQPNIKLSSDNLRLNDLKMPKLKSGVSEKLDQILESKADKEDLKRIAKDETVSQLRADLIAKASGTNMLIKQTAKDQSSETLKAITDAKTIAYNAGLGKQVDLMNQQVDAISKRFDTHNIHMNEVTKVNEALNADFRQAAGILELNTKSINNKLVPSLKKLIVKLHRGFTIPVDDIATEVYKNFKLSTGLSAHELIKNELYQQLKKSISEAQEAKSGAQLYSGVAKDAVTKVENIFQNQFMLVQMMLIEISLIIGCVLILPGWTKVFGLIFTLTVEFVVNEYLYRKKMINDD